MTPSGLTVLTVFAADILGMDAIDEVSLQIEELDRPAAVAAVQ